MSEYTPDIVIERLAVLRYLRFPLRTPEKLDTKHHEPAMAGSLLESQIEELADLEPALYELSEDDFVITAAAFVLAIPFDVIADGLGIPQKDTGIRADQGARYIAERLGWTPARPAVSDN